MTRKPIREKGGRRISYKDLEIGNWFFKKATEAAMQSSRSNSFLKFSFFPGLM
jgi:hypothetical protein